MDCTCAMAAFHPLDKVFNDDNSTLFPGFLLFPPPDVREERPWYLPLLQGAGRGETTGTNLLDNVDEDWSIP